MMKSVFFACLVAAVYAEAAPEADADAWYGYGAGYSYGARPYVNLGYRSYNSVAGYAPYVAARSYGAYPAAYGYGHAIGKRSADAEAAPEADADAWYGNYGYAAASPAYYGGYRNYGYAAAVPAVRSYNTVAGLASYSPYVARSYAAYPSTYGYGHAIGKRSADAEAAPEADADAWYGNNGYAAPAYGYSAAVAAPVSAYRYAAAPVSAYRYAAAPVSAYSYAPYAARSYGYAARSYGLW